MKKALVLSLAVVLGLGVASFAQTLSGSWDTKIGITPQSAITPVLLSIDSELVVTYTVSGWTFTSTTTLDETGWLDQTFEVGGALGAFTLGSTLDFAPGTAAFQSWEVTGGLSLAGVTFTGVFTLLPGDVSFDLVGAGTAGAVDVTVDLLLGTVGAGCDFNFNGVTVTVDFPFCCAKISSEISFTCAGFQSVTFAVDGIAIPNLPWVTLDMLLTFTPGTAGGKTLVLTPAFDFGGFQCITIILDQVNTPAQGGGTGAVVGLLSDITISGIGLDCTIGAVDFTGISYWGTGAKPGLLKGTSYWEAYRIATSADACCGGMFDFDVTVYFLQGGLQLFDVAKFVANVHVNVTEQFTFYTGISVDLAVSPSFTNWIVGFNVTW
ncbi:MAG: hypothetical protein NTX23_05405 [Candidatus Bipolaricaulota bacterium]|nr:hypothetical protein [Candidatus Bipolaricaulota bacterium]